MNKLTRKICTPEGYLALTIILVTGLGVFSENARAAGLGLFQYVADSYLVMFVDSLSMSFICF
ncbi:MAG: hypothetical protein CMP14_06730 [Rickettsiales bacterium]|jgi:hypothetical protein|nr:hypothetical protein [Rickettsiales bacterium]|tara:strand:- start:10461 stop:10649 length:189 start_codon:yes stop_codon:yes gene_type:complete